MNSKSGSTNNLAGRLSLATLLIICLALSLYRINRVNEKEIAWDVLGYYLYLPATFIYDDPMLNDIGWLQHINDEKHLTGTLYMVSTNDEGQPMYFFLMGMALFYLPFFFLGQVSASVLAYPMDGFSLPYQYALVIGGIIYTIIGLIYLRKILKRFFSEWITSLVMIIIVFGTNYIHHLTLKDLETVNVLFMLAAIIIWNTIKWHENQRFRYLLAIGVGIVLMALVKPSEVVIILLPLLWHVYSKESFKQKLSLIIEQRRSILIVIGLSFILVIPQMTYWYLKTGYPIYDSYKNPGVGLDIFSPHILNVLFSYRKGWLVYTPVMIFSLIGFYYVYKDNRKIFFSLLVYFLVSFYIISSWSEWWYGAAFSNRPLITVYPVLAITFGYFLVHLQKSKLWVKTTIGVIIILFIALNQFQWWQLKHYILDPYRTTKAYYWKTFLKTSASKQDKELLLIKRSFGGDNKFTDEDKYNRFVLKSIDFEGQGMKGNQIEKDSNFFYRIEKSRTYFEIYQRPYKNLTSKDHLWIRAGIDVRFPKTFKGPAPILVLTMERKEGAYGYKAFDIQPDTSNNQWKKFRVEYLTPQIRNSSDRFHCYLWIRGENSFDIDNIKIEMFERK